MNNTDLTHYIATDANNNVFGTGTTLAACKADAAIWTEGDVDGLTFYLATEAAFAYAAEHGADALYEWFAFKDGTVRLAETADPKSPWPQVESQLALVQNDVARIREQTLDGSSRSVLSVERKDKQGAWLEVGRYEIDDTGREWAWGAFHALTATYAPGHAVALSA